MGLTDAQRRAIVEETVRLLGPVARIRLFGSRLDDSARGGDVDLLVETPAPVARPALTTARLAVKIERRLDGRHVDIVLVTPETHDDLSDASMPSWRAAGGCRIRSVTNSCRSHRSRAYGDDR